MPVLAHLRQARSPVDRPEPPSCRPFVEEVVDTPRRFGTDAIHLHQVGDRSAFDCLQRPEVIQQSPLSRWADARALLQSGLTQVAQAAGPMGADRKPMRFVAQPLNEIQTGMRGGELEEVW